MDSESSTEAVERDLAAEHGREVRATLGVHGQSSGRCPSGLRACSPSFMSFKH